jgi:hypothetical protein
MRREIHLAAAAFGTAVDSMSGLQKTGPQDSFLVQLAEDGLDLGCEEGWVYGAEKGEQGGI